LALTTVLVISAACSHEVGDSSKQVQRVADCGNDSTLSWVASSIPETDSKLVDVGCVNSSGKRHGPAIRIADGVAISFANFNAGELDGPSLVFSSDGSLEAITISKSGQDQRAYFWSPAGWIQHSSETNALEKSTTHTYWYATGLMKTRFTTMMPSGSSDSNDATLDGHFSAWHQDGTLLASGSYVRGTKSGPWRCRIKPSAPELSLELPKTPSTVEPGDEVAALDECVASHFRKDSNDHLVASLGRR
jgi:hypothetical protein